MESYLRVNLLGPGPRLLKKEFTGPPSHKGWETLLYTDLFCPLAHWWDKSLKAKEEYMGVLPVPPANHLSCRSAHLSKNEFVGFAEFIKLVYESTVCFGKVQHGTPSTKFPKQARPGRQKATATKLGIYSTHSPRSSIHFLGRCSNYCKLHK